MTERMEVEHIVSNQQVIKALDNLLNRMEKVEKVAKKTSETSKKGADAAAGSFNALEQELKQNEAALRNMASGTKAFADQRMKVDRLRQSVSAAKEQLRGDVAQQSGATQLVSNFTGAIAKTAATIVGVGAIVASLRADFEKLQRGKENARLAEVDFGQALGARTISNLPEQERLAVRPLAMAIADAIGAQPGGVAESLGALRSSGAESIMEAGAFLKEAAQSFPQDLAAATEIAKGALIEARATGNRDAQQVIGRLVQSQAVSQVTSVEDYTRAFSAVNAAAVQNYKLSAERAHEEAAFFSTLEPKSAEVAATAERQFFKQVSQFQPALKQDLKSGGTTRLTKAEVAEFMAGSVESRIAMLERGGDLQRQFIDRLSDEGRAAIQRRITLGAEDKATFTAIQQRVTAAPQAATELQSLQQQAQTVAAFAIAQGQREAQKTTGELRKSEADKLAAEIERTYSDALERIGESGFGSGVRAKLERASAFIEPLFTGKPRAQTLQEDLQILADTETNQNTREFLKQQLDRLENLSATMDAVRQSNEHGNQILQQLLQQKQPVQVNVQAPAARPKEDPVPAVTIP